MSEDTQRYIRHFLETERELALLREQLAKVTAERDEARQARDYAAGGNADLGRKLATAIRERDEARANRRKSSSPSHLRVITQHEARDMKGETE